VSSAHADETGSRDEAMISVIYVSSAAGRMSDADLQAILGQSRRNNERDGVTGMLLYSDGNFIQAIEGPEPAIDKLLRRIEGDRRHGGIITIARYPVEDRQFGDWSMGFRPLEKHRMSELLNVLTSMERPLFDPESPEASSMAHRLLEGFRDKNRG
jgi:Sensors of blue-light using FAD